MRRTAREVKVRWASSLSIGLRDAQRGPNDSAASAMPQCELPWPTIALSEDSEATRSRRLDYCGRSLTVFSADQADGQSQTGIIFGQNAADVEDDFVVVNSNEDPNAASAESDCQFVGGKFFVL